MLDLVHRKVEVSGQDVKLTPKEYDVLCFLARHAGKVVTHHQVLREVWGPAHAEDVQYLRVLMRQLRRKIEADASNPQLLLTEPGVGYRLIAPG
jgi:two-component system KDP operon response regulator KdpE